MTSKTFRPTFYLAALGLAPDFDAVTLADVKTAYATVAKTHHPDVNPDSAALFTLISAAYTEVRGILTKKRGKFIPKSDEAWLRSWDGLAQPSTRPSEPKAAGTECRGFSNGCTCPTCEQARAPKAEEPKADATRRPAPRSGTSPRC
jgi:hypothetical protein